MRRHDVRSPNIENIYILSSTQVFSNPDLKRGCLLEPLRIYAIDQKYTSFEKLPTGKSVQFKISVKAAAELILADKAVCVKKDNGEWIAVDVFGDKLPDGMPIVLKDDKKKKAVA